MRTKAELKVFFKTEASRLEQWQKRLEKKEYRLNLKANRIKNAENALKALPLAELREKYYNERMNKMKYDPHFCEAVIEIGKKGGFIPSMQAALNVRSETTFYDWMKEYPEFKEAYEFSRVCALAFWEKVLLDQALGLHKGSTNAAITILTNRFRAEYSRGTSNAGDTFNIQNNVLNIEKMSNEQLALKIKEQIKQQFNIDVSSPALIEQITETDTDE